MTGSSYSRRRALVGLAAGLAMPALVSSARAAQPLDAQADFGLEPNGQNDQTARLQAAVDAAAAEGRLLMLPAGGFYISALNVPGGVHLIGMKNQTLLTTPGDKRLARLSGDGIVVEDVVFQANAPETAAGVNGLIEVEGSTDIFLLRCHFLNAAGNGVAATDSAVTVQDCAIDGASAAGIHLQNGGGATIRGTRISNCGNAGIRIWRDTPGLDGTIVTGNRIERIDWRDGGNGQNGNGVSIFRADGVIVADNVMSDCAFTAVRINAGRNTQVRGNTCLNSGEVAIFSEFEFSGSVIADNIVDGAATGISITNLDSGGHLATCTGNVVRNITPASSVNPDTTPVGIFAEADTVISGNTVENVPGVGIAAGYGPFLRNVAISGNVVTGAKIGIGVSVVQEQSPGPVRVDGNIVSGAETGIAGMEWEKIVSDDLARDADRYPNVSVADNSVAG